MDALKERKREMLIEQIKEVFENDWFMKNVEDDESMYNAAVRLFGTWKCALKNAGIEEELPVADYYKMLEEKKDEMEDGNPFCNRLCNNCIWRDGIVCVGNCCRKIDRWLGEKIFNVNDRVVCRTTNTVLRSIGINENHDEIRGNSGKIVSINDKQSYAYVDFGVRNLPICAIPFQLIEIETEKNKPKKKKKQKIYERW